MLKIVTGSRPYCGLLVGGGVLLCLGLLPLNADAGSIRRADKPSIEINFEVLERLKNTPKFTLYEEEKPKRKLKRDEVGVPASVLAAQQYGGEKKAERKLSVPRAKEEKLPVKIKEEAPNKALDNTPVELQEQELQVVFDVNAKKDPEKAQTKPEESASAEVESKPKKKRGFFSFFKAKKKDADVKEDSAQEIDVTKIPELPATGEDVQVIFKADDKKDKADAAKPKKAEAKKDTAPVEGVEVSKERRKLIKDKIAKKAKAEAKPDTKVKKSDNSIKNSSLKRKPKYNPPSKKTHIYRGKRESKELVILPNEVKDDEVMPQPAKRPVVSKKVAKKPSAPKPASTAKVKKQPKIKQAEIPEIANVGSTIQLPDPSKYKLSQDNAAVHASGDSAPLSLEEAANAPIDTAPGDFVGADGGHDLEVGGTELEHEQLEPQVSQSAESEQESSIKSLFGGWFGGKKNAEDISASNDNNIGDDVASDESLEVASLVDNVDTTQQVQKDVLQQIGVSDSGDIAGKTFEELAKSSPERVVSSSADPVDLLPDSIDNAPVDSKTLLKTNTKVVAVADLPENGFLLRVPFSGDAIVISDEEKDRLTELAQQLSGSGKKVKVISYAEGNPRKASSARRISLQRAISIRSHMIRSGLDSKRINVQAVGDKHDGGDNANSAEIFLVDG